tara:strand:+ start:33446 stop:33895 length:450 start_codon:yes stop_codon:yes gene_type:complete
MLFPTLPLDSKVWIYQSDRELSDSEASYLYKELTDFVKKWAAHGTQLFGDVMIVSNRFVILVVDETNTGVSGCSIDTSVQKIKELGANLDVDFFNRMNLYIENNGTFKLVHISELKEYTNWTVFNPMVSTLKELRNNWKIPVTQSNFLN